MTIASATASGTLYIVATPIGHRDDISLRAIEVLKTVDVILAEDTRHSGQLLLALGIKNNLVSLHAHNEADRTQDIITGLQQGKSFALISDAGTPLISDPGFPLVNQAKAQDLPVIPIPGACAFIAALSASGVPCETFTFCGFLPAKTIARREKLTSLSSTYHTLVFYESTHRIVESIEDIALIFGPSCELVLAKELTKAFERIIRASCSEIKAWLLAEKAHCKGEFVIIIPARQPKTNEAADHQQVLKILLTEVSLKQAVRIAAQITGGHKNELYKMALEMNTE
jgi:16S rRNA (cytidine1402-2'-O)-methyltransferase